MHPIINTFAAYPNSITVLNHCMSYILSGIEQYAIRAFADALDDIPMALAENAGLQPIVEVSNIKSRQLAEGNPRLGKLSFAVSPICTIPFAVPRTCTIPPITFFCISYLYYSSNHWYIHIFRH